MQLGPFWIISLGTQKGPWHISYYAKAWYIVNIIKNKNGSVECKRIGSVRGRGINHCDRARETARKLNEEFLTENREYLPMYLGICPEFDFTIKEMLLCPGQNIKKETCVS